MKKVQGTPTLKTLFGLQALKYRLNLFFIAFLNSLKHKYPGLEGDTTSTHVDFLPDEKTGLYTLCFTDTKRLRYKATMERFKVYSKQTPVISRGVGKEQVLVGFHDKNAAVEAFGENLDSDEFPKLHIAPGSRK